MTDRKTLEDATGKLFGTLWPSFDDKLFRESVQLFDQRLGLAGIDPRLFADKECLDAGCGGGRNSIAMAMHGARHVIGIDLGEQGLVDARARAAKLGHDNIRFEQASVLDIPLADASVDWAWCAGVLMHTDDPDRALAELTRVLRPGGRLYLLVYATEGLRWPLILLLRPLAAMIGLPAMEEAVVTAGLPANKRRTFLDDLYTPRLDFYDWSRLRRMLEKNGYCDIERWGPQVRLDHEHSIAAYRDDLQALADLFAAGEQTASGLRKSLFEQGHQMITATLGSIAATAAEVAAGRMSEKGAMDALIGQGHHRIVAVRGESVV